MDRSRWLELVVLLSVGFHGCAATQKKIAPRYTYRAGFVASNDGKVFHPLLDLLSAAEKARPSCLAVNRNMATKAQYVVERRDSGIKVNVTECESSASDNCDKLKSCLSARPVAWLSRESGRQPELSGSIITDWIGRCGGTVAVNFYYGPQAHEPLERVGCSEPAHDELDTAYEMFTLPRPGHADKQLLTYDTQATGPLIENLLRKWDGLVFSQAELLPH